MTIQDCQLWKHLEEEGSRPEAIKKFVMSLGLTKANTFAPFDALEAFNRKFVDCRQVSDCSW